MNKRCRTEGYRKTDCGIIPEDWGIDTVANVASISTGAKNTQDKIDDGFYPFFVRSQTVERINSFSFDGEAVLTAGDGVGTGKIYHYINGKFDFHQRVYKISEFDETLKGYFFYIYFSKNFYHRIMQMTAKSSVDSVRREMIAEMKVPLPPVPEQEAIARVLSDVDALITSLDELIEKRRNIKQGAMQLLLTSKKRLTGFSDDWTTGQLGDVADVVMGQSPSSVYYNTDRKGLPLIQGNADINDRKTIIRIYTSLVTRRCEVGDTIMSVRAPVGEVARATFQACIGRGVCRIRYTNDFVYHLLLFSENNWSKLSKGSTFDSVNSDEVKEFEVFMPQATGEQEAIAKVIGDMGDEIESLELKRNKYAAIKQGMMQELLTGKTRLV
ncbi:MAG: restriction endonuclease subunit S [Acidobacteria bacterium]|nr:restriction endonuclease subunit S [Acidobacteriota bacterium]